MPVVEYKMHAVNAKGSASAPLWVDDGGYHQSQIDKTLVGWVLPEADREFYVPDTVTEFTKTTFINRQLGIHAKFPMKGVRDSGGEDVEYDMYSAGITTEAGNWYDAFVSSHSG